MRVTHYLWISMFHCSGTYLGVCFLTPRMFRYIFFSIVIWRLYNNKLLEGFRSLFFTFILWLSKWMEYSNNTNKANHYIVTLRRGEDSFKVGSYKAANHLKRLFFLTHKCYINVTWGEAAQVSFKEGSNWEAHHFKRMFFVGQIRFCIEEQCHILTH